MAFKPPKVTLDEVSQTINLKELFGIDFTGLDEFRTIIGEAIIERIVSRTESGEGLSFGSDGSAKTVALKSPYSKTYADSPDFKAFGKSKSNVNMKLTGDMLGLLDVVDQTANTIKIGWDDSEQNPKAYNHMVGDTVPKRPFFGISKSELKEIVSGMKDEIRGALKMRDPDDDLNVAAIKKAVKAIREDFELDLEDEE